MSLPVHTLNCLLIFIWIERSVRNGVRGMYAERGFIIFYQARLLKSKLLVKVVKPFLNITIDFSFISPTYK